MLQARISPAGGAGVRLRPRTAPGPHVPTAPFPCQHLQPLGFFGPFSKGESPDRAATAPCPCPCPPASSSSLSLSLSLSPLIAAAPCPVPTVPGVPGAAGLWLSWSGIRAGSQSQLHDELPQLGGRSRSQQWEEGQSHSGSLGGKVHPLGWGGAGKESLSKGLAELWVWLETSADPTSVQPKSKVCVPANPRHGGSWADPVCRENNWTLCCLITTEPCPA